MRVDRLLAAALSIGVIVVVGALSACGADSSSDAEAPGSGPSQTESSGSPEVTEETSASLPGPTPVPDEAAAAYDAAVTTMSTVLQQAGAGIVAAQEARDVAGAREAAQRLRDAIFAFDATVRRLDLSSVESAVEELLDQDAAMLARLDAVQEAFTTGQVAQRIARVPTDAFIAAFQSVADAIHASRS